MKADLRALAERLRGWARDLQVGRHIYGADQDLMEAANALEALLARAHIETLRATPEAIAIATARAEAAEAEVARLRNVLDTERYKVALGIHSVVRAVQGRQWLSEPGRGSYTYDDGRYQAEFGAALNEIDEALAPLRQIAGDWSDCPCDPLQVAANRSAALEARNER